MLLIGILFAFISSIHCQRVENIKSGGAYFKNRGGLKIQDDVFVIASYIDLTIYHSASVMIDTALVQCRSLCLAHDKTKLDCSSNTDLEKVEHMKKKIEDDLENLYQTFGKKSDDHIRKRRNLNIRPRLFTNKRKISSIYKKLNNLEKSFENNLNVVKSDLSNQQKIDKILKDGNDNIAYKISLHEIKMNNAVVRINKLEIFLNELGDRVNDLDLAETFSELRSTVFDISQNLVEVKQSIMDLQKNVIHSNIISPEEIMSKLLECERNQDFLAIPQIKNYQKIMQTIETEATLHTPSKTVMIFIGIPLYVKNNLLYEIINVPMIKDSKILSVPINDKFCVIKEDKSQFHCMNSDHDFLKMDDFYISTDVKDIPFLPISVHSKCVINIFQSRSFENCNFKEIPHNIEIFEKLEANTYLFALRDETTYSFECNNGIKQWNNFGRNETLSGTGILHLGYGCKFNTEYSALEYDYSNVEQNKGKSDVFNVDMNVKIDEVFKNHVFIKEAPTKKSLIKFSSIKLLKFDDFEELQVEDD
ncbi:hypothetical protein ACFFRR_008940 [Megaselia abdita]